jgi:hypothetical protein
MSTRICIRYSSHELWKRDEGSGLPPRFGFAYCLRTNLNRVLHVLRESEEKVAILDPSTLWFLLLICFQTHIDGSRSYGSEVCSVCRLSLRHNDSRAHWILTRRWRFCHTLNFEALIEQPSQCMYMYVYIARWQYEVYISIYKICTRDGRAHNSLCVSATDSLTETQAPTWHSNAVEVQQILSPYLRYVAPLRALPTAQTILIVGSNRELSHLLSNRDSRTLLLSSSQNRR